jgi:hypothetical protein
MRIISKIVLAMLFSSGVDGAFAQHCDPRQHLTRDTYVFDEQIETEFSLYKERQQQNEKEGKTAIGFSYDGIEFAGDNATRAFSSLNSLLKLEYSESQKRSLFTSTLPQVAVDTYIACLQSEEDISHSFSNNVLAAKKFFVTFYWHPQVRPQKGIADAKLRIIGGKFLDSDDDELTMQIEDRGSIDVAIERELFEPTEIRIQIGSESHGINLPPKGKYRIASEILSSNPNEDDAKRGKVKTLETTGRRPGPAVCAQLPNEQKDATMIPGQKSVVYKVNNISNVGKIEEWNQETDRGVCFTGGCNFHEVWSSYCHVEYDIQIGIWRSFDVSKTTPAAAFEKKTAK